MRGRIIESNDGKRRWLYIPEAHIQLNVAKSGEGKWVVAAFRTDGYYGMDPRESIPTIEHIERDYHLLEEVEVPDYIADFAVDSERRRQESVDGIVHILEVGVESQDPSTAWERFRDQLDLEKVEDDFDGPLEQRIGEEVHQLLSSAGNKK